MVRSLSSISQFASFSVLLALVFAGSSCVKTIHHNPDVAAINAVEFARVAIIQSDYSTAYQKLSDGARQQLSVDELKTSIEKMHPNNWPRSITASEYEPVPGQKAIHIFLRGKNDKEDFVYLLSLEGTADTAYTVSGIIRLQSLPPSTTRFPLPIRRSTENPTNSDQFREQR